MALQSEASKNIFNMPKDTFHFFDDGTVNGREVVNFLGLKKKEVAAATNVNQQSIRYDNKIPAELKERLIEWAIAINLAGSYFQDRDKTILWLQTPNELLGDLSPRDMIRLGRFKKLHKFIKNALKDNMKDMA